MAEKKKSGRPPVQIDKAQFENLCRLQCTEQEIASWFGISHDTLNRWCKKTYGKTFEDTFAEKREAGKISLRRAQFQMAQTNPTMNIWLSKQYLGQKETQDINITQKVDSTIDEMEAYFASRQAGNP